jgi:hypothetical protein
VKTENGRTILVVPNSLWYLCREMLPADPFESVEFEPPSNVQAIHDSTFHACKFLKSICLPASVERLGSACFQPLPGEESPLETVTFEPGSKLRKIPQEAFSRCTRLRSICLPPSVKKIRHLAFAPCGVTKIEIEPGSPHFRTRDNFVVDFDGTSTVLHFGEEKDVRIPDGIKTIGAGCFSAQSQIESVSFGPAPKVRLIDNSAFRSCNGLNSICVPQRVQKIGYSAFADCKNLASVTFDPESRLECLEPDAFSGCVSLKSFCVPSSVRLIGYLCFHDCVALSQLTFASPSHLAELGSLPTSCDSFGSVDIPDSVELLASRMEKRAAHLTINFGDESQLKRVQLTTYLPGQERWRRAFVRIPARRLKAIRGSREFEIRAAQRIIASQ